MGVQGVGVRSSIPAALLAAAGLAACAPAGQDALARRSADLNAPAPARRSGLWEQTIQRDGKAAHGHGFRICLDNARQDRQWVFGDTGSSDRCQRQITRDANGAYHFTSTCRIGDQAVVTATGVATGDFVSSYEVRSVLTVSGAPLAELDGRHDLELVARYRGACPAGMTPGQISVGRGLKIDARRLPQLASAFAGA